MNFKKAINHTEKKITQLKKLCSNVLTTDHAKLSAVLKIGRLEGDLAYYQSQTTK